MKPAIVDMLAQISRHTATHLRLQVFLDADYAWIEAGMFRFSTTLDRPGALFDNVVSCADTLLAMGGLPKCECCCKHQAQWKAEIHECELKLCSKCTQLPISFPTLTDDGTIGLVKETAEKLTPL